MERIRAVAIIIGVLAALGSVPALATTDLLHDFVGAKKCSVCHKTEAQGEQYRIWQDSHHSKAFETLGTARAKELAKSWGVDDPQKSGRCLKCHSTAYYFTEARVSQDIAVEEGVSCESCHGPGKDYMKKSTMADRAKAVEAGLVLPDEKTCTNCHGAGGPVPESFDFKKSWDKIKHPKPSV